MMASKEQNKIFISYSRVNKDFAIKLARGLKESGFSVWLDVFDIPTGSRWDDEIEKALATCSIFMVILTPTSVASDNVKDEIGYAIDNDKRIVPVLLEDSTIPLRLRRFQYVDFTSKNYEEGIESAKAVLLKLGVESKLDSNTDRPQQIKEVDDRLDRSSQLAPVSKPTLSFKVSPLMVSVFVGVLLLVLGAVSWFNSKVTSTAEPTPTLKMNTDGPIPTSSHTSLPTQIAALTTTITSTASPTETSIPSTPTLGITSTLTGSDGMILYYVPSGDFVMGSNRGDVNEQPVHTIYLDAFWIDSTEVTNAMYAVFLTEQGNQADGGVYWLDAGDSDVRIRSIDDNWVAEAEYKDHPVMEVSWYGADAYCSWVGRSLPTEAQWEKAARGGDERDYPWGNDVSGNGALNYNNFIKDTVAVGKYPRGASPYGVLDMAGNVSEWVADWYSETFYRISPSANPSGPSSGQFRIRRGGSFFDHNYVVRSTYRAASDPDFTDPKVGFRCAMSATP